MRVLLVTNGLAYGGAERVVEALALDLLERGDSVRVVATTRDGPIGERLRARGVSVDVLGIRSRFDLSTPLGLARLARAFEPDVIHSHLAVADVACAAAALVLPRRPRLISSAHNSGVELDLMKRWLWHVALRRFDAVLPVSREVGVALPAGLPGQVIEPSLVSLSSESMSRGQARQILGVPDDQLLVLGVGRLVPVKGFDVLARAAPLLAARARVLVVGEGEQRHKPGALTGLELPGAREDAAQLLIAADVVVSPSRSEGFPQVVLQSLAFGLPVVATAVGGTGAMVEHEQTGLIVPVDDPKALAQAIDRLLADKALAGALGARARARVIERRWTKEAMIERVRAVYSAAD